MAYEFQAPTEATSVTVILASGLDQNVALSYHQKDDQLTSPPDVMPKAFRIETLHDDKWEGLIRVKQNHQRFCRFSMKPGLRGVRFLLDEKWGSETSRIYAFYVD